MMSNNTTSAPCTNCTNTYPELPIEPYDILKMIFGSLSIILNGVLLLAMLKERKRLFVSRVSYLVANLALADFLMGAVLVFIIQPIQLHERKMAIVNLELPFIWAAMLVSFLTLFLMSAERFVVVALPMLWSNILTTRRTIIGICIIWCLAIISAFLIHYRRYKTQFALIVTMEVSVVVFIAIHVYIVWWIHTRQSHRALADDTEMEMSPWPSQEKSSHVSAKQQGEVTTVVVILLVVLIVTILPHFICLQIFAANMVIDDSILEKLPDFKKYVLAYEYTDALSYLNFVVNPIVYAWRLTMYRNAFAKLLKSLFT